MSESSHSIKSKWASTVQGIIDAGNSRVDSVLSNLEEKIADSENSSNNSQLVSLNARAKELVSEINAFFSTDSYRFIVGQIHKDSVQELDLIKDLSTVNSILSLKDEDKNLTDFNDALNNLDKSFEYMKFAANEIDVHLRLQNIKNTGSQNN